MLFIFAFFQVPLSAKLLPDSTIFDLIYCDTLQQITLEVDFEELENHRFDEDRFPAVIHFSTAEGKRQVWEIEVNVRGRFRRMRSVMPPLKLNFSKDDLRAANLDEHNNLKLVTHFEENWRGNDWILREYLTYQIYRELTEASYRSQLAEITYKDSGSGHSLTYYGIILEDEKELADRLNSDLCEDCYNIPVDSFDQKMLEIQGLFQYMIGNADWSPIILRNVKLLKPHNGGKYLFVPYDFDFSGLVNPDYAVPPKPLGIANVRQRIYLGYKHHPEDFQEILTFFQAKKPAILRIVQDCEYLNRSSQREITRYIESFFKKMEKIAPNFEELLATAKEGRK